METLVSIKRHKYNGVYNNPGDTFTATRQHAKALKVCKLAKDFVPPPPEPEAPKRRGRPPGGSYQRKDMVADD